LTINRFEERLGKKYPHIVISYRSYWKISATFFRYLPKIKELIYSSNPIESLNNIIKINLIKAGSYFQAMGYYSRCVSSNSRSYQEVDKGNKGLVLDTIRSIYLF
jgi:transposase-like protein